jgi:hypothetical protein
MTLTGFLTEYSLAEIINFIHQDNRTGLLWISGDINTMTCSLNCHYAWFQNGQIVAVANTMNGHGLLDAILQRKLIPTPQIEQLKTQINKLHQPLGLYLKSRSLLTGDQLKLLFNSQTVAVICKLFELEGGRFHFDPCILPYTAEMTGISLSAQEVGFLGLRMLRDWSSLSHKLPDPQYALQRLSSELPNFRLDRHEEQLWKLSNGETSIDRFTEKMGLTIDSIQKIAFRLIAFGLVQEIPIEVLQPEIDRDMPLPELLPIRPKATAVSTSFLGNLMGFLKRKG